VIFYGYCAAGSGLVYLGGRRGRGNNDCEREGIRRDDVRVWTSVRSVDGLITECSAASAAQEGDEVIDAAGGTVLPGLIGAHVHLVTGAAYRLGPHLPRFQLLCYFIAWALTLGKATRGR
jgi:cytosine/adenosine deaminase-related metal-dependent hydrolase